MNFITGAGRSGTTLAAQVFQSCGANFGNSSLLLEHKVVREIVNGYLQDHNFDPMGQNPLPTYVAPFPELPDLMPSVEIVKQCKILLLWQEFHKYYPDAKWVFVRRNVDKIADSCLRTPFMNKYRTHEAWVNWAEFYIECMEEAKQEVNYIEVWPSQFKESPDYTGMQEAVEFLGYTWNEGKARACICPSKLL